MRYKNIAVCFLLACVVFGFSDVQALGIFDLAPRTCEKGSTLPVATARAGEFRIDSSCEKGVASSTFFIKDTPLSREEFFKKWQSYKTYGDVCKSVDIGSHEESVGGHAFKRVCGMVGSFPLFYVDGKKVESYEVFGNTLLKATAGQSLSTLVSLAKKGPICDSSTTTKKMFDDKVFTVICKKGFPAEYLVDQSTTTFGVYAQETVRVNDFLCKEEHFGTTTFHFASRTLSRVCKKGDIVGALFVDSKRISFREFDTLLKSFGGKASIATTSLVKISSRSELVATSSCSIPASSLPFLVYGRSHKDVLLLQTRLHELGYLTPSPNGYFGGQTRSAVKAFQKAHALPPLGSVGKKTLRALNESCSS